MDALQSANTVYKRASRLIIAGRATSSLYEECQQLIRKASDSLPFTRSIRVKPSKIKLGQWRSRRLGFQRVCYTSGRRTSKRQIVDFEQRICRKNHPCLIRTIKPTQCIEAKPKLLTNETQQPVIISRMDVIFQKRTVESLIIQYVDFLTQSTRKRTYRVYGHEWRVSSNWCYKHGVDSQAYNPKAVYHFLYKHAHPLVLQVTIVSAFNTIHKDKRCIAEDPLIVSFFQVKRKSDVNIPSLEKQRVWDIE